MALSPSESEKLHDYQEMMGAHAGNLALALDSLTDLMAMLGQHKVYCRVEKGPCAGQPPLDLTEILATTQKIKALIQETLLQLRQDR